MKDHFTLEQKVGQLFVLGFQGYEPDRDAHFLIERLNYGLGLVLLRRNLKRAASTWISRRLWIFVYPIR